MEVPMIVNDFLRRAVDLYGPKLAVVDDDKRFTYTDFAGRCHQLAHALSALGIGKGDRVGIVSPNSHHFLESFYGTSLLGAVLVPLNYRLLPSDFAYALNHAGASVVLADSDLCPAIDEIMAELSLVEHRVVARYRDAEVPDGWLDWEQLIAPQSTERPPDPLLDENDLVSINYTQLLHQRVPLHRPLRHQSRRRRSLDIADVPLQRVGRRVRTHQYGCHARDRPGARSRDGVLAHRR